MSLARAALLAWLCASGFALAARAASSSAAGQWRCSCPGGERAASSPDGGPPDCNVVCFGGGSPPGASATEFTGLVLRGLQAMQAEQERQAAIAAEQARHRRAEAEARERERERERERAFQENKGRLLSGMGVGGSLSMKGDEDEIESPVLRFMRLHSEDMRLRWAALGKLGGAPDEKWCRLHILIPFPSPPIYDPLNQYPKRVARYRERTREWDERCGGPSLRKGYPDFTIVLTGWKPRNIDREPAAVLEPKAATATGSSDPSTHAIGGVGLVSRRDDDVAAAAAEGRESGDSPLTPLDWSKPQPAIEAAVADGTHQAEADQAVADARQNSEIATPTAHGGTAGDALRAPRAATTVTPESLTAGAGGSITSTGAPDAAGPSHAVSPTIAAPSMKDGLQPKVMPSAPSGTRKMSVPPADPAGEVMSIITQSPTFLAAFRRESPLYQIRYGPAGGGTYILKGREIVIDGAQQGRLHDVASSLAHELGHAGYRNIKLVPASVSESEYVRRMTEDSIADEVEATVTTIRIRWELLSNGGPSIPVPGAKAAEYEAIVRKYPDSRDAVQMRREIGQIYAVEEQPSTDPGKNYQQYYSDGHRARWKVLNSRNP